MRTRTLRFAVLVPLIGAMVAVTLPHTVHAACSVGSHPNQREVVLETLQDSELVLVGHVVDERSMSDAASPGFYESVVVPEAVLAGELPADEVVVRYLGYIAADCSGGPRLQEGERVLLGLHWQDFQDVQTWRLHGVTGKVLLTDEEAVSQYANVGVAVGSSDVLVRDTGAVLGSTPAQIDAALAALATPVPTAGDDGLPLQALAGGALLAAAFAFAAIKLRRRVHSRR